MATVHFRGGTDGDIDSLAAETIVAVDLGFAKSAKSCGLAWRTGDGGLADKALAFGACIEAVVGLLKPLSRAVLILEAPLSGTFNVAGNPRERGRFEQRDTDEGLKQRYWYSGPGAGTCLAAIFFCRELRAQLRASTPPERELTIVLYEGFVSFKPPGGTPHCEDARRLRDGFLDRKCLAKIVTLPQEPDTSIIAVTAVIGGADGGDIPAILVVDSRRT